MKERLLSARLGGPIREHAALSSEELGVSILEGWGKVLTHELMKDMQEGDHCLSDGFCFISLRQWIVEVHSGRVAENLREQLSELAQNEVDDRE